jgi:tetratricopeptide (TPR) repeat protein
MIRTLICAAILGGGIAAAGIYAFLRPGAPTAETWPVCSTMASLADSADWAPLDPDFAAGKRALATGDWEGAIAALTLAAMREPDNADIANYIGYAYRRLRQAEAALAYFRQALAHNPRHRGARQHLGEAHLSIGNVAAAEEQLAALERICLLPCEEQADLHQALVRYKASR